MGKCGHVDRVAIHPSVKVGGASVGVCDRDCLPGMTVCAWHADPDAVTMRMAQLADPETVMVPWDLVLKPISKANLRFMAEAADTSDDLSLALAEAKMAAVKSVQDELWALVSDWRGAK